MTEPVLAALPDSSPLLGDHAQLRARWDADGVLYFRGVIDKGAIATVHAAYLERLKQVGVVEPRQDRPVWNGCNRVDGKHARIVPDSVWRGLVGHPSFDGVVRSFLGEAPSWVPIVVHRAAPPVDPGKAPETFGARHQDGIFNYGIDFITCWVPLMDIDADLGGLAVIPGSHQGSLYAEKDAHLNPGRPNAIPADSVPPAVWRRPDYKAGDLLIFHSMTAHAGLPNLSDQMRLSMDVRFLPGSMARPVVGSVTEYAGQVVHVAAEQGQTAFTIDDATVVRGVKGTPVTGAEIGSVVFPGANIIAVPDGRGHARLVRPVSRKYLDLPAAWFTELPDQWVR